jgi:hypothetical protein
MISTATRNAQMRVVAQSPAAVAAHDKARWLGLWASNHVVEDPVGSRPVLGGVIDRRSGERTNGALSRFWDAFIAANDIVFDVHNDFVGDHRVVRDVTIRTTLPSGVRADTPAHLLYELVEQNGEVTIRRMAAHWEVARVFVQLMRPTPAHVQAMLGSFARMIKHLGIGGTVRFVGAVGSVGPRGKQVVLDIVGRAGRGDPRAIALLGGVVPRDLTKVIASGDTVTASCIVDDQPAVLIATLNRRTRRLLAVDVYCDAHREYSRQLRAVGNQSA